MKSFPNYLVSTDNFGTNDPLAIGTFQSKRWTPEMIALLGSPSRKNEQGVPFYPAKTVEAVVRSEAFAQELQNVAKTRLETLGGSIVDDNLILAACMALYDVNKFIKAKKYTCRWSNQAYDLKTYLLRYLFEKGMLTKLVFEQDTNLYRFVVEVEGQTFVWHQPLYRCGSFVPKDEIVVVTSDKNIVDGPMPTGGHNAALKHLERVMLDLIVRG